MLRFKNESIFIYNLRYRKLLLRFNKINHKFLDMYVQDFLIGLK